MGKSIIIKGADYSAIAIERVTLQGTIAINVVSSNSEWGTVAGTGMYNEGDSVQISATAVYGYNFIRWNDGNENATRQITVGSVSQTYTAIFEADSGDVVLQIGAPIVGEYYTINTAEIFERSGFNRYGVVDVSMFAGRTLEINATLRNSGSVAVSLYSDSADTLYNIEPTGELVWKNANEKSTGGSATFVLPSNVKNLYLCYDSAWHQGSTVFSGVVATIKAES